MQLSQYQRRRTRGALALLVGLLTTFVTFIGPGTTAFAGDGDLTLAKTIEGGVSSVPSGQPITYRLTYSCNANGSAPPITCDGATLVDTIPTFVDVDGVTQRMDYVSSQGSIDTAGDGVHDPANGTVSFTFDQDFDAGSSGFVLVTLRPPFHTVLDGTVLRNTSVLQLHGQQVQSSIDATVTAKTVLTTTKVGPLSAGLGNNVRYGINVCVESGLGRLAADGVVVTDTIPTGAVVVSTTPPATTIAGNIVQWTVGRVRPGTSSCEVVSIVLQFPSGPFSGGQVVVNNETVSGQQPGSPTPPSPASASASTTLIGGDLVFTAKSANVNTATTGDRVDWRLTFESNGSDPLRSVVLTDTVPPEVRVTTITTGTNPSGAPVTVEYSTDGGISYRVAPGSPFPGTANRRIDVATLIPPSQFITNVRYSWGVTTAFWNDYPILESVVINPDRNGTPYGSKIVTNCMDARYSSPTTPNGVRPTSCADVNVTSEPSPSAGFAIQASATRGTTVRGIVFVENYTPSTAGLSQPVVSLVVPSGFTFVPGSTTWNPVATGMPAPDLVDVVPNWDGSGDALVRWRWSTPVTLPRGLGALLLVDLRVGALAPAGTRTFRATISNRSGQPGFSACNPNRANNYVTSDPFDRDGDGATTDQLCEALTTSNITSAAGLDSSKEVQGELDATFTSVGNTTPGGRANYRLTVQNNGSQTIDPGATFIDILPGVGDTLVASTVARGSEWSPYLVAEIQGSAATVEYSTAADPCRPEVGGPRTGCTPPNWTPWNATLAANPTVIRSLKFTFPTALAPAASHVFTWEMRVPLDLTLIGKRAYNSFAYSAQPAGGGPALISEPPKVELLIAAAPGGGQIGDYTWNDLDRDGTQGVNEPPIQGTLVELWSVGPDGVRGTADDPRLSFTRTDNRGLYLFQSVPPGRYYIRFVGIPDTIITTQDAGGDDEFDSDAEPGTGPTAGWTDAFDFCNGAATCNDRTRDAGFISSLGSLRITKNVTGSAKAALAAARFTVHYDCGNGKVGDILLVDGQQDVVDGIAPGSSCALSERTPTPVNGVTFGTASFNPVSPILVTGRGAPPIDVILTNPATLDPGSVTITKTVSGPANVLVPNTTEFTVDYTCTSGATGNVRFTPASPGRAAGLAAGDVCRLTERAPAGITGVTWGTAVITPNPVTIAAGANVDIAIDNPTTLTPGSFLVRKSLAGSAQSAVPNGTAFTVDYNCGPGYVDRLMVTVGSPTVITGIPAGNRCTLTETPPTNIPGVAFGTPSFSPSPTFTIAPGTTVTIDLSNPTTFTPGDFSIHKTVQGTAKTAIPAGTTYSVHYDCGSGNSADLDIEDNQTIPIDNIPAGSRCTITERTPTRITGLTYGTPVISPSSFTVQGGGNPSITVTVTNPATLDPGAMTISKTVTGPGSSRVPNGTTFTVDYNCGNGVTGTVDVTLAGAASTVSNIPAGSRCNLTEQNPGTIPGVVFGQPTFTPASPILVPGGGQPPVAVVLENPTNLTDGSFTITKRLSGAAASSIDPATVYTINWTCTGGISGSVTFEAGITHRVGSVPAGSDCTVDETTPAPKPGIAWATPIITPASFHISGGTAADVVVIVENVADVAQGGFSVTKSLTGTGAGLIPANTEFEVGWSCDDGTSGSFRITRGTTTLVSHVAAGSTCTLVEANPAAVAGIRWDPPTFSPSATFTVAGGTSPTTVIDLVNTATSLPGSFTVTKRVTGGGQAAIDATWNFIVFYACSDGANGSLTLQRDATATLRGRPAGTTCRLSEAPFELTDGLEWSAPVFDPGAEFTIVADQSIDIVLTNAVEQSQSSPVAPGRPGGPNTPPNPNSQIPVTGTNVQGWLAIGATLLLLGVGILVITRRRNGTTMRN